MTSADLWYRSDAPAQAASLTWQRRLRACVMACLPEPDVRRRVMVMQSRTTMPAPGRHGFQTQYHGLFSEFHSVLGALHYARERGAAGIRVNFRSPLYADPARGSNWWLYFFDRDVMRVADGPVEGEVVLDTVVTKYGRYGGFSDVVQGVTPYYYPMTFGLDRHTLRQYVDEFATVRADLRCRAAARAASLFDSRAFVVGVHYRGTDAVLPHWRGWFRHYRVARVPYAAYADEVRRVLDRKGPARFQVFVATDERDFVEFMRAEFADAVVAIDAPRAGDDHRPVHLNPSIAPAIKGESAMLDALLLAATHYLVKGRSNLSDASLIFNPGLPYSFYPDVPLGG